VSDGQRGAITAETAHRLRDEALRAQTRNVQAALRSVFDQAPAPAAAPAAAVPRQQAVAAAAMPSTSAPRAQGYAAPALVPEHRLPAQHQQHAAAAPAPVAAPL
jgi:hypothetical protein